MADDRRNRQRFPAEVKIDYRSVGSFITDYSANMSKGGVFVQTSLPLAVDTKVKLRVTLPGHQLPFCLDGVVRWSRSAKDGEPNPGMGIQFDNFDDATKREIEKFITSLDDA